MIIERIKMKYIVILILSVILIGCESNSISSNDQYRPCSKFENINGTIVQCGWIVKAPETRCSLHK